MRYASQPFKFVRMKKRFVTLSFFRFKELIFFCQRYGHCNVPKKCASHVRNTQVHLHEVVPPHLFEFVPPHVFGTFGCFHFEHLKIAQESNLRLV